MSLWWFLNCGKCKVFRKHIFKIPLQPRKLRKRLNTALILKYSKHPIIVREKSSLFNINAHPPPINRTWYRRQNIDIDTVSEIREGLAETVTLLTKWMGKGGGDAVLFQPPNFWKCASVIHRHYVPGPGIAWSVRIVWSFDHPTPFCRLKRSKSNLFRGIFDLELSYLGWRGRVFWCWRFGCRRFGFCFLNVDWVS